METSDSAGVQNYFLAWNVFDLSVLYHECQFCN